MNDISECEAVSKDAVGPKARINCLIDGARSPEEKRRLNTILSRYMHGRPFRVKHTWDGIPTMTSFSQDIMAAFHDTGFRGTVRIEIRVF